MSKTIVCLDYPPFVCGNNIVKEDDPDDCYLNISEYIQQLTDNFLDRMLGISVHHPDYNMVFLILFCHNGFYYSRKIFDMVEQECLNAGLVPYSCSRTRFWFYHRINRLVKMEMEGCEINSVNLDIRYVPSPH